MTTQSGYVMTLANSIIGVSLLAMPYCFKQCGILLGILLLIGCNIVTRLACYFLIKSAVMCRRKNFEFVAYHAFGGPGKLLVELGIIGFLMGTCVAFFVVIGDLAPAIISNMFELENSQYLRTVLLIVAGLFIILPLSLVRNMESLAVVSTLSMLFYISLLIKLLVESLPHLTSADWTSSVNFWRPQGILQILPIFGVALSCQTQVFEILQVLPNPTLERMNSVVHSAVGMCTVIYIVNGCLGYIAYAREPFGGNILLSFSRSLSTDLFQLGFVVSVALSFPIAVFPCRASLNSLLYKNVSQYHELNTQTNYIPDRRFKTLTLVIVGSALCTGLLVPNIEFVLGFVGSTIGVAVCVVFPNLLFISIQEKQTSERLVAKVTLALGIVLMVLGTYSNIEAASGKNVVVPAGIPNVKIPAPDPDIPRDLNLGEIKKEVAEAAKIDPQKVEPPLVGSTARNSQQRKEPPVPVEPVIPKEPIMSTEIIVPKKPIVSEEPIVPKESIVPKKVSEPLPAKESIYEEKKPAEKPVAYSKPADSAAANNASLFSPAVKVEGAQDNAIHQDAIAKEELELKEHSQPKVEEERKQKDILNKILEEQKKLLQEQQNILEEIKSRDPKPLAADVKHVKPVVEEKVVEPIKPEKFSDNIDKIQEVIDDLKVRKQVIDKNKGEKIAEEKKRFAEKKIITDTKSAVNSFMKNFVDEKNLTDKSVPVEVKTADSAIPGRDILEEKTQAGDLREKRDADAVEEKDGSCKKSEKVVVEGGKEVQSDVTERLVEESLGHSVLDVKVAFEENIKNSGNPRKQDIRRRK